jgi:hypothetical protein
MFSERAKLIALAIVHVFETSKPFGDYSAVAVLDDGAGVSYGINQFTHKSGSLYTVINTYLGEGGSVGADHFELVLPTLKQKSSRAIVALSNDHKFKKLLKDAGETPEMRLAQQQVMENFYLLPAIDACEGSHFELPLSLAVIYDSINHGSFEKIRDKVTVSRSFYGNNQAFEKAWITDYVRERHAWLNSVARLKKTSYRTAFLVKQIANNNWDLDLPLNVHGVQLTEKMFIDSAAAPAEEPTNNSADNSLVPTDKPLSGNMPEIELPPTNSSLTVKETLTENTASMEATQTTFTPETVKQYIPQITGIKRWMGTLSIGGMAATAYGAFSGMPLWAVFVLGFLTAMLLCGLIAVVIIWKKEIFALVKHVVSINADPLLHNIALTTEKPQ